MSTSCNENASVKRIQPDGKAVVIVRRAEACHSCAAKGACQSLGGQTKDMTLVVENTLDVKPGDEVVLTLSEASVIKASATLYLVPAVGLVGGATLGWSQAETLGLGADPASILGSLVGLALGFLATRWIAGKMARETRYIPKISSVISQS